MDELITTLKSAALSLLMVSSLASADCSKEQYAFVKEVEAIQQDTLYKMQTLCQNNILYFADHITLPYVGAVAPDLSVGVCDKRKNCTGIGDTVQSSKEAFKKKYLQILHKKSI